MEIKKMNDYSDEELRELLFFWFKYYGKSIFSLDEIDKYNKMLEENPKAVFKTAVILYAINEGPTRILEGIRGNMSPIEDALKKTKTFSKQKMAQVTAGFIKEVVTTYNNPEPDIPMQESDFLNQLLKMLGVNKEQVSIMNCVSENSIDPNAVKRIARDCVFKENELVDGMPTKDFTLAKCLESRFAYCTERLEKNKKEIKAMVDKLPPFTRPRSFNELSYTRTNERWGYTKELVESLLTLAIACGYLSVSEVKNGVPYFVRNKNAKIISESPDEFPCFKGYIQKKLGKNLTHDELVCCVNEIMHDESKKVLELLGYRLEITSSGVCFYDIESGKRYNAKIRIDNEGITFLADIEGKTFIYSFVVDKIVKNEYLVPTEHIVIDSLSDGKNKDGEYFKATLGRDTSNLDDIWGMSVMYATNKLPQKVYKYFIGKDQLSITLESDIPDNTNEFSTERSVYFTDPTSDVECPNILYLAERKGNEEAYQITINRKDNEFIHELESVSLKDKSKDGKSSDIIKTKEEARDMSLNYLKTKRARNLCNRVIEVIDAYLPGIKDLINEYHPFSSYIESILECDADTLYEDLMNKCSIKEANVPGEDEGPKRKRNAK